jgi:aminoglycoside phosphotransferase family enzyme/predicted kinase
VTRDADGVVRVGGVGETIDVVVEMRRLPADRMLDRLLESEPPGEATLGRLVALLADFHAGCATGPGVDEHAGPDRVRERIARNLDRLAVVAGARPERADAGSPVLTRARLSHMRAWLDAEIGRRRGLMLERIEAGRVREGHGDLHAGNICLTRDGPIVYDRIEFNRAFRCLDVGAELAFLAMDLDLHGHPSLAAAICDRYASRTGDATLADVQPLYRFHYAVVRAMVDALRAREAEIPGPQRLRAWTSARAHADLGAGYTLGACLVVLCGLPGAGKSHVARAVGVPLRARVHRSDEIRKRLLGVAPTERLTGADAHGAYSRAVTDRVYDEMLRRARADLGRGRSAVLDATFAWRARREAAVAVAEGLGVAWLLIEATAPEEVIRERMRARGEDASEVSDASFEVYLDVRARFEPPDEIPGPRRLVAAHGTSAGLVVGDAIDRLL